MIVNLAMLAVCTVNESNWMKSWRQRHLKFDEMKCSECCNIIPSLLISCILLQQILYYHIHCRPHKARGLFSKPNCIKEKRNSQPSANKGLSTAKSRSTETYPPILLNDKLKVAWHIYVSIAVKGLKVGKVGGFPWTLYFYSVHPFCILHEDSYSDLNLRDSYTGLHS